MHNVRKLKANYLIFNAWYLYTLGLSPESYISQRFLINSWGFSFSKMYLNRKKERERDRETNIYIKKGKLKKCIGFRATAEKNSISFEIVGSMEMRYSVSLYLSYPNFYCLNGGRKKK